MRLTPVSLYSMNTPNTFIPAHLRESVKLYIEHGISPGSFVSAVLDNDLMRAVRELGNSAPGHLVTMTKWFMEYAPTSCWGSESKRLGWLDARKRDIQEAA